MAGEHVLVGEGAGPDVRATRVLVSPDDDVVRNDHLGLVRLLCRVKDRRG